MQGYFRASVIFVNINYGSAHGWSLLHHELVEPCEYLFVDPCEYLSVAGTTSGNHV